MSSLAALTSPSVGRPPQEHTLRIWELGAEARGVSGAACEA